MGNSSRFRARLLSALVSTAGPVWLGVMTLSSPAAAEPTYPSVIQETLGGTCAPQCTLCHTRPEGGQDYLKSSGLSDVYVPKNLPNTGEGEFFANLVMVSNGRVTGEPQLRAALSKLASANCNANSNTPCDSDGDKIQDTKEFAQDGDPDIAHGDLCIGPTYGCGATITPLPRDSTASWRAAAVLAALGVGIVAARRLQRRPRA